MLINETKTAIITYKIEGVRPGNFKTREDAQEYINKQVESLRNYESDACCEVRKAAAIKDLEDREILEIENKYANQCGYSDHAPYEIVRIVSEKTIEIRAMDYSENKSEMEFQVGGFGGHCNNNHAQDYDYSVNEENPVIRIRLHKHDRWKDKWGRKYNISSAPYRFYDYNF
jgi:hypothetical protein